MNRANLLMHCVVSDHDSRWYREGVAVAGRSLHSHGANPSLSAPTGGQSQQRSVQMWYTTELGDTPGMSCVRPARPGRGGATPRE
jgi:hypothetical protein